MVHYARGELTRSEAALADALISFREALREDPASPLARAGHILLSEDGEARLSAMSALTREWPSLARVRFYLGSALAMRGRPREALAHFRQACVMNPEDIEVWGAIAQASLRLDDREAAKEAAEKVLSLGNESFRWHRFAAKIMLRAKRFRLSYRIASHAARRFSSPGATLLPWTLPYQVAKPRLMLTLNVGY
jgi:tetratricopeptide (TPR) repeat protein